MDWITALKTGAIRDLVAGGHLQLGLFDERNLCALRHPDVPGERLVACRNPERATLRTRQRHALLAATRQALEKVRGRVVRGKLKGRDAIGVRVGKVINQYTVAKHFRLVEWHLREAWRPLLFCDEDQTAKQTRDPVAPAERSAAALRTVHAGCF